MMAGGIVEDGASLLVRKVVNPGLGINRVAGHTILNFNIAEMGRGTNGVRTRAGMAPDGAVQAPRAIDLWMASRTPLTNCTDSSFENLRASSRASSILTGAGVPP